MNILFNILCTLFGNGVSNGVRWKGYIQYNNEVNGWDVYAYTPDESFCTVVCTVMEQEEDDEKAYNLACDLCDSINNGTEDETLNRDYGKAI